MPQLSLFQPAESVLVDDASGRIAYTRRLVDGPTAQAWFAELRETVPWKAERRRMYDREVDVPRLTAHFPLGPDEAAPPDAIRAAADYVIDSSGSEGETETKVRELYSHLKSEAVQRAG